MKTIPATHSQRVYFAAKGKLPKIAKINQQRPAKRNGGRKSKVTK